MPETAVTARNARPEPGFPSGSAMLRTIGIETSCDETAVAVLASDGTVEATLLSSQVARHAPFGGIVPELASREHLRALPILVQEARLAAPGPIELVAVTAGPGLIGALLVGVRFASAYAWAGCLPLVAVDHLEGHLVSPFLNLEHAPAGTMPQTVLALVASGGHASWYLSVDGQHQRLCRTRDDAAGEALDKVGQALGLPYPGGPVIDRLARDGNADAVALPRPRLTGTIDLSFSGLKSAAIRWIRAHALAGVAGGGDQVPAMVQDFLASFECAVVDHLLSPLPDLVADHRPHLLTVSGGVAANTLLRKRLREAAAQLGVAALLPQQALTTDNAAMIARAGQLAHARGLEHDPRRLDARARRSWQPPGMRRQQVMRDQARLDRQR